MESKGCSLDGKGILSESGAAGGCKRGLWGDFLRRGSPGGVGELALFRGQPKNRRERRGGRINTPACQIIGNPPALILKARLISPAGTRSSNREHLEQAGCRTASVHEITGGLGISIPDLPTASERKRRGSQASNTKSWP